MSSLATNARDPHADPLAFAFRTLAARMPARAQGDGAWPTPTRRGRGDARLGERIRGEQAA